MRTNNHKGGALGAGYRVEVCYGFGEARAVITDYLGCFK